MSSNLLFFFRTNDRESSEVEGRFCITLDFFMYNISFILAKYASAPTRFFLMKIFT